MNVDLLSKMLTEVLLDHDEVSLPFLGTFVAEMVPASFSDRGYTINPPYRKLIFRQKQVSDNLLVELYANSNKEASMEDARRIIHGFMKALKIELERKKVIVLPGLGRLRATKENIVFFVADENLNIFPAGFGLEPVSLKSHYQNVEIPEIHMIIDDLVTPQSAPAADPLPEVAQRADAPQTAEQELLTAEPEKALQAAEPESEAQAAEPEQAAPAGTETSEVRVDSQSACEDATKPKKKMPLALKLLFFIIAVMILVIAVFYALVYFAPDFLDSLLYTEEELRILNYPL